MTRKLVSALLLLTLSVLIWLPSKDASDTELPNTPSTFYKAKKLLYNEIYTGNTKTFYCGCDFNPKDRTVDLDSCGIKPRKNPVRANRVEAEHVFPAHQFGKQLQCWREPQKVCGKKMSGRKCCLKSNELFRTAHNDLRNLVPAVGEINGDPQTTTGE